MKHVTEEELIKNLDGFSFESIILSGHNDSKKKVSVRTTIDAATRTKGHYHITEFVVSERGKPDVSFFEIKDAVEYYLK